MNPDNNTDWKRRDPMLDDTGDTWEPSNNPVRRYDPRHRDYQRPQQSNHERSPNYHHRPLHYSNTPRINWNAGRNTHPRRHKPFTAPQRSYQRKPHNAARSKHFRVCQTEPLVIERLRGHLPLCIARVHPNRTHKHMLKDYFNGSDRWYYADFWPNAINEKDGPFSNDARWNNHRRSLRITIDHEALDTKNYEGFAVNTAFECDQTMVYVTAYWNEDAAIVSPPYYHAKMHVLPPAVRRTKRHVSRCNMATTYHRGRLYRHQIQTSPKTPDADTKLTLARQSPSGYFAMTDTDSLSRVNVECCIDFAQHTGYSQFVVGTREMDLTLGCLRPQHWDSEKRLWHCSRGIHIPARFICCIPYLCSRSCPYLDGETDRVCRYAHPKNMMQIQKLKLVIPTI
eukprot:59333_1